MASADDEVPEIEQAEMREDRNNNDTNEAEDFFDVILGKKLQSFTVTFFIIIYTASFSVFIWFAVIIIRDYMDQQKNPVTVVSFEDHRNQAFPSMILCNIDPNVSLIAFADTVDSLGSTTNFTLSPLHCKDDGNGDADHLSDCVLFDNIEGNLTAFASYGINQCPEKIYLDIFFNVDFFSYSNETPAVGIDGVIFSPDSQQQAMDLVCSIQDKTNPRGCNVQDSSCKVKPASMDTFIASTGVVSMMEIERDERKDPVCGHTKISWNPQISNVRFNKDFFRSFAVNESDDFIDTLYDSFGYLQISFASPTVRKVSYQSMSWQTLLGGLAGWFGFLSDGWGFVTLIFILHKMAKRLGLI